MYPSTFSVLNYSRMNTGDTNLMITNLGSNILQQKIVLPTESIPENLPDFIKISIQALIDSAKPYKICSNIHKSWSTRDLPLNLPIKGISPVWVIILEKNSLFYEEKFVS